MPGVVGAAAKAAPTVPDKLDIKSILKHLDKYETVLVPAPDGHGVYCVQLKTHYETYGTPGITWMPYENQVDPNTKAVRSTATRYGRQILWYPRGLGYTRGMLGTRYRAPDKKELMRLAELAVSVILSGYPLHSLPCGNMVTSAPPIIP